MLGNVECCDDVICSLIGLFERSFEWEISVEPFEVVNIFDDVT